VKGSLQARSAKYGHVYHRAREIYYGWLGRTATIVPDVLSK
jgi:hypothetical protein